MAGSRVAANSSGYVVRDTRHLVLLLFMVSRGTVMEEGVSSRALECRSGYRPDSWQNIVAGDSDTSSV